MQGSFFFCRCVCVCRGGGVIPSMRSFWDRQRMIAAHLVLLRPKGTPQQSGGGN